MFEPTPDHVKQKIDKLLSNYEYGRQVLTKPKSWDSPVPKVDDADPDAPDSWLGIADEIFRILAHDKYDLDTYPNSIEIIDTERMLDANAKIGLPIMYNHWSFGKRREKIDQDFKKGNMGLALEIILNTDPSIAYLMEGNSKTSQAVVIAHASYGHNNFFKKNYMFQHFSEADDILYALKKLTTTVEDCERKYGEKRVERLLDACHALENYGVDPYDKNWELSQEEKKEDEKRADKVRRQTYDPVIDATAGRDLSEARKAKTGRFQYKEGNLLRFIADTAPHLEEWERDIMRQIAYKAQYFQPQKQDKVMNEGWATFWHYTMMYDLHELGLVDDGMMQEFLHLHAHVVAQFDFDDKRYSGLNPYALGFAIFSDLKRLCQNPTEEDYRWFPTYAGCQDWLNVLKEARDNYHDETFIQQFLSPKVMRDFRLFAVRDDDREDEAEVLAVHDYIGYEQVRDRLAYSHNISAHMPQVYAAEYDFRGDRSLTLHHHRQNRKPLDQKDMQKVLNYMEYLWQHPVHLESYDESGHLLDTMKGNVINEPSAKNKNRIPARPKKMDAPSP